MLVTQRPTEAPRAAAAPRGAITPLVHVVEDEPGILDLFRSIGARHGFEVATYRTKQAFLDAHDDQRLGCVVIDLNLPDGTGIEILERLACRACSLPIVFTSGRATVAEAVAALKLGSLDFVEKPFSVEEIVAAIERAVALDAERRSHGRCRKEVARRFARLSPREREVLELVVQGAPNKEMASRLGLSPKTIEVHRANVMRKTEAGSLAELVRMHVAHTSDPEPPLPAR